MSGKKCKLTAPNGQAYECKPSIGCTDCEYHPLHSAVFKYDGHEYEAIKDGIKYKSTDGENWVLETEELKTAYEAGKMLQYQKENGEWVDFSKNTVCDDFKFQEHLNYRIKPKCKWTPPNGQEIECKPSLICGDCEYNTFKPIAIKYEGHEFEACQDGVKYKSTDGKNWVPETEHKNVLTEHDYTKIQNYIEAIRLIAEKVGTAESDCIEQLARDAGNYLYDLVKGGKNE